MRLYCYRTVWTKNLKLEISYFFPKKLKFRNKASDELLDDDFTFPVKRSSWRNRRFLKIFNSGFWLNPMIIISLRRPTNLSMTTSPFPSNCRYDDGIAKPLLLFLQQLHGGKSCFCNNFMGDCLKINTNSPL